jgi:hypothetical protein
MSDDRHPLDLRRQQDVLTHAAWPDSYGIPMARTADPARIHMLRCAHVPAKEGPMLDLLFLGGGVALLCLMIAYARLTNRI